MKNIEEIEEFDGLITITVDAQNDFCPGGSLPVPDGDAVIEPMNRVNRWTRDQGGLVVLSRDWHPPVTKHFDIWTPHCIQYKAGAAFHNDLEIVDGNETFEYSGEDLVVSKGMGNTDDYSAFDALLSWGDEDNRKELGTLTQFVHDYMSGEVYFGNCYPGLRPRKSLAIAIGGLATEKCDEATAMSALELQRVVESYNKHSVSTKRVNKIGVFVIGDAMRALDINPGDGDAAIARMVAAGAQLVTSDDIVNDRAFAVKHPSLL